MVTIVGRLSGYFANTRDQLVHARRRQWPPCRLDRPILAAIDPIVPHGEHPAAGTLAGKHDARADLALGRLELGRRDALGFHLPENFRMRRRLSAACCGSQLM